MLTSSDEHKLRINGKTIRAIRGILGLNQSDIAQAAKVSVDTISKLERGETKSLSPSTSARLIDGLGLSLREYAAIQSTMRIVESGYQRSGGM